MKLITPARHLSMPGIISRRAKGLILDSADIALLQGDRSYSIDANMILADGAAAVAASGYFQNAGADGIVDFGGNQNITYTLPSIADVSSITPQQARIDAVLAFWVSAVTTSGTAAATVYLLGSNDPAFGVGKVVVLGSMPFGAAVSASPVNGILTPAPPAVGGSMYEILFTNEQNNVKYQFAKLYGLIANSGSITLRAGIFVLPEP
jgi:hypothetical protein